MTVILFLFIALSAFAQEFQYRIEGSFPSNETTVNYSVSWNETSTDIQGLYQDNILAKGPTTVTGTVTATGRTMNVILPTEVLGIRQITLQTPTVGTTSGSIPMNIKTLDNIGRTVDNPSNMAMMSTMQAATSPGAAGGNDGCVIGFGALTGYCGLFNGSFNEINDNRNRCNLLSGGNARLELAADTFFRMYLNYIPGSPNPTLINI